MMLLKDHICSEHGKIWKRKNLCLDIFTQCNFWSKVCLLALTCRMEIKSKYVLHVTAVTIGLRMSVIFLQWWVHIYSKYFQVDFQQLAHITEIAVQGHHGDIEKYVKKYFVQWSNDFNFWHHVPEEVSCPKLRIVSNIYRTMLAR